MVRLFTKECNRAVLSFALLPDINDLLMTMLILSSYELCTFKADGWLKTRTCTFALRMYRREKREARESYKVCLFCCAEEFVVYEGDYYSGFVPELTNRVRVLFPPVCSLAAQRDHRIDLGRTSGGEITSQSSYAHQNNRHDGKGEGIARANPIEQVRQA
jgi:hypothetical protein